MTSDNIYAETGGHLQGYSKWNFALLVGIFCSMSYHIWAALPDSSAQHVHMFAI